MALIELTTIKTFLGISGETYDAQLTLYRDLVIGEIESLTGRVFEQAEYENEVLEYEISTFDGRAYKDVDINYGNPTLILRHYPLEVVSGEVSLVLEYDGTVIDTNNYNVDAQSGIIYVYGGISDSRRKLTATYTAGYTEESLPKALELIFLQGIQSMFEWGSSSSGSAKVSSKSVKNFSVSYKDAAQSGAIEGMKSYLKLNLGIINSYSRVV